LLFGHQYSPPSICLLALYPKGISQIPQNSGV